MNKLIFYLIVKLIVFSTQFQINSSLKSSNDELTSSLDLVRSKRSIMNISEPVRPVRRLTNEKRLIKDLLDNYQVKWGRPVNNMSEKVVVYFGINLVQLLDLVSHFCHH
jgi:hypothetical protein